MKATPHTLNSLPGTPLVGTAAGFDQPTPAANGKRVHCQYATLRIRNSRGEWQQYAALSIRGTNGTQMVRLAPFVGGVVDAVLEKQVRTLLGEPRP
jgi:hypothetical protein